MLRRGMAQLVVRFVRDEEVVSSSLTTPTKHRKKIDRQIRFLHDNPHEYLKKISPLRQNLKKEMINA